MAFTVFSVLAIVTAGAAAVLSYLAARVNVPVPQVTWGGFVLPDDPSVLAQNKVAKLNKAAAILAALTAVFSAVAFWSS